MRRVRSFKVRAFEKSVNTSWISVIDPGGSRFRPRFIRHLHILQCQAILVGMQHNTDVVQLCSCSTELCNTRSHNHWILSPYGRLPRSGLRRWIIQGACFPYSIVRMPILHTPRTLIAVDSTTKRRWMKQLGEGQSTYRRLMIACPVYSTSLIVETDLKLC